MTASAITKASLDRTFWIPLASGAAVTALAAAILTAARGAFPRGAGTLYPLITLSSADDTLRVLTAATTTRFLWSSAELVLTVFLVSTAAFGVHVITSRLRDSVSRRRVTLVFALPVLFAGVAAWYRVSEDYGIARAFLAPAYRKLDDLEAQVFAAVGDWQVATVTQWTSFTKVTDALAAGTILLVILAFGALLNGLSTASIHQLADRTRKAAQLLYLAAALLAASVIQLLVLLSWPVAYLSVQQRVAAQYFEMMASGMTMMVGVLLTTLLFAVTAPVFTVIKLHARSRVVAAQEGMAESAINELLTQHGLGSGVWRRASSIIAVMSPALAGIVGSPVAGLFTRLFEATAGP